MRKIESRKLPGWADHDELDHGDALSPAERKTKSSGDLVRTRKEGWVLELRKEVTKICPR